MDRLLIHRDQEPSRPIQSWQVSQTKLYLKFGVLPKMNVVSSPNVERKTRSLTVDEVRSSRERTPEYCTSFYNRGWCCGGICAKNKNQRSEGGHYRPFWWGSNCCPKMKGGRQNNVQPLVSPWSWDYTLLLLEDTATLWRSFSHTCWVTPTAFTYEPQGSARINIP